MFFGLAGVIGQNLEVLARTVPEGAMGGDVAPTSGSGTANGRQWPNLLSCSIRRVGTRTWIAGSKDRPAGTDPRLDGLREDAFHAVEARGSGQGVVP